MGPVGGSCCGTLAGATRINATDARAPPDRSTGFCTVYSTGTRYRLRALFRPAVTGQTSATQRACRMSVIASSSWTNRRHHPPSRLLTLASRQWYKR